MTKNLYRNFLKDVILDRRRQAAPFVYVDSDVNEIRYLTELLGGNMNTAGSLALSVGNQGDIEILFTE